MKKSFWLNLFLICVGIVAGSLVAELTVGVPFLEWLSYGLDFGTESPFVLNLNVLRFTFGISFKITISTIIFVALSLVVGRAITKS